MEKKFKKVSGERLVAALVDSIIVSIVSGIPIAVYMFKDGLDGFLEQYMDSIVSTGDVSNAYGVWYFLIAVLSGLIVGYLYFAYLPSKMNGQTLGKKMMSIKAIDEFGNNPSLKQHSIRAVQVWGSYAGAICLPLLGVSLNAYSIVSGLLGTVVSIITFVAFIMILAKDDGRGIHDTMAGTYVVKADIDLDKDFVEKTTQMGDWADVEYKDSFGDEEDKKDDWYE